jgi:hypothetical protein
MINCGFVPLGRMVPDLPGRLFNSGIVLVLGPQYQIYSPGIFSRTKDTVQMDLEGE